jgi:hypothetical protein
MGFIAMTELQCLIKIMKVKKLPKEVQDIIDERLGEIESKIIQPVQSRPILPVPGAQAPSMQRIIDQQTTIPEVAIAPPPVKIVGMDKETGRPMIQTGKGTLGPKKW